MAGRYIAIRNILGTRTELSYREGGQLLRNQYCNWYAISQPLTISIILQLADL